MSDEGKQYLHFLCCCVTIFQIFDSEWWDKQKFSKITMWCDCGPHFRNKEMLLYAFNLQQTRKIEVELQYFVEKHGKSDVDSWFSVVSRALEDWTKRDGVLTDTTDQLIEVLTAATKEMEKNYKAGLGGKRVCKRRDVEWLKYERNLDVPRLAFEYSSRGVECILTSHRFCFDNANVKAYYGESADEKPHELGCRVVQRARKAARRGHPSPDPDAVQPHSALAAEARKQARAEQRAQKRRKREERQMKASAPKNRSAKRKSNNPAIYSENAAQEQNGANGENHDSPMRTRSSREVKKPRRFSF